MNSLSSRLASRLTFESIHARDALVAACRGNGFSAYWYREILNFGDLITPLLLRHYGFTPIYERPMRARLVAAGSLLEHLRNDYAGIILGSGFIEEKSRMTFPEARVLAVRGALTRERIGRGPEVALGDPGLLASVVLPARQTKRFVLGIVPHYSDTANPVMAKLAAREPRNITLIDVARKPMDVFRHIDQCEHILSSSLHGLIVADSLGIPNGWLASKNLWGGRFKFDDYYSGLGVHCEPAVLRGDETLAELVALTLLKANERIQENRERLSRLWSSISEWQ